MSTSASSSFGFSSSLGFSAALAGPAEAVVDAAGAFLAAAFNFSAYGNV